MCGKKLESGEEAKDPPVKEPLYNSTITILKWNGISQQSRYLLALSCWNFWGSNINSLHNCESPPDSRP
jgi:hypothetical protein